MIREGVIVSDRYEVVAKIGTGGMAEVYKAIDQKLNRYVALKVLKAEFREDESFVNKFRSEAQAAAAMSHPNVVNVYDVGEDLGLQYIVMELVEGITLKEYIQKKGRLTPKEVISIAVQVCSGIEVAHNNNIVHRDIKPQNIMISLEGKVKVTDFGIAKATSSNTISTNAMGSVHYTSPEQARGGFADAKSDIYSLGITMYEMITGELPFDGESTVAVALKHLQEEMKAPSQVVEDIPYSLERIILKCTQKSPDRRYADMGSLMRDLRRSLAEPNGDFVVIAPFVSVADTVIISQDELDQIQEAASQRTYVEDDDDYEYDEYEEEKSRRRSDIDPKMTKIMKILTIVVTALFIFMLVFIVGTAMDLFNFEGRPSVVVPGEDMYIVPPLVGKTEEEARLLCEEQGLELYVSSREKSEYEEGIVCKQSSQEGTKLLEGAKVSVVVSEGLKGEEIELPEFRNKTESAAKKALIELGFREENIEVIEREDDSVDVGRVIATIPGSGSKVTADAEIQIIISKGAGPIMVPRLLGKTDEDAKKALEEVGLKGKPTEEFSDLYEEGKVFEQSVEPGERVDKNMVIEYKISKGAEPKKQVVIPNVVGQSVNAAVAQLRNEGLYANATYSESTQYNKDIVISMQGAGTTVEEGTYVTIVISTGPGPAVTPPAPETTPETTPEATPDAGSTGTAQ